MSPTQPIIFVAWPNAPLTTSLVHAAIAHLGLSASIVSALPSQPQSTSTLVQWASYDCIDHVLTASEPNRVLSSSYTIRKALIRKHFLARCIQSYVVKRPESLLTKAAPPTWDLDITYADELDEMWSDELWTLGTILDGDTNKWFILKPSMADRGMGIRLFNSRDALYSIFQEFDRDPDEDEADEITTSVMTSQLRHFVIQEYISNPLLIDPNEVSLQTKLQSPSNARGRKFHLRTYVVASGALTLFMYERILALFSAQPYCAPCSDLEHTFSLAPHLTNTSLQTHHGEENVRLLDELIGCRILSGGEESSNNVLKAADVAMIKQQIANTLAEAFRAALAQPIHFQPLPNAFELFGVDFLVSHEPLGFQVKLLEMNSEPAIELTGPRLTWILEDLFKAIGIICIHPFVPKSDQEGNKGSHVSMKVGEAVHNLRKCLDIKVYASVAC